MAVKTSTFTGWKLSGKDAEAFVKQVDESRQNERAQAALLRGRDLCKQISERGYTSVKPKKEKSLFKRACDQVKSFITK